VPGTDQIILFTVLACVGYFWWSSTRAKELAVSHARQRCSSHQLQFLDQTVALSKIRPQRNHKGHLCWRREYEFEYTGILHSDEAPISAGQRDKGYITLLGQQIIHIELPFLTDDDGKRTYLQ